MASAGGGADYRVYAGVGAVVGLAGGDGSMFDVIDGLLLAV